MKVYHLQAQPIELEHLVVLVVAINGIYQPQTQPEQVQPTKDLRVGKRVLMFPVEVAVREQ